MGPSSVTSTPRVLIFDTGPLRELLAYDAVHQFQFESLRGELRHLNTVLSYQRFTGFIGGFRKRTTTPHVVAEICSWIRGTRPRRSSTIWEIVFREFEAMGMDEGLVKLREMPQELVAKTGAADTGILKHALSFPRSIPLVISIDRKLIEECKNAGVPATSLWEVTAS